MEFLHNLLIDGEVLVAVAAVFFIIEIILPYTDRLIRD